MQEESQEYLKEIQELSQKVDDLTKQAESNNIPWKNNLPSIWWLALLIPLSFVYLFIRKLIKSLN